MDALILGLVILCGAALIWMMLRKLGVGTPGGRPDCGCGSCGQRKQKGKP
ncbi:MAG TPA: hypothetical protein PKY51_10100 [Fimbriimonadaceae bacterium]|nr:hypothetical protein [Fimbriimonadaceae bacterium]